MLCGQSPGRVHACEDKRISLHLVLVYFGISLYHSPSTEYFCLKNEQLSALTWLEGTSWYQGKDLVEEYIDWFMKLIDLAEYHDNKMIVIKFHRGLELGI